MSLEEGEKVERDLFFIAFVLFIRLSVHSLDLIIPSLTHTHKHSPFVLHNDRVVITLDGTHTNAEALLCSLEGN